MADTQPVYRWKGIDKQGKRTGGSIQSSDINAARTELKKSGTEVISIAETKSFSLGSHVKKRIKQKDILLFTRLLSTMLTAGLPIVQAIDVIARDQENIAMRSMLNQIKTNLAGGKTLTEAFRKNPKQFNNLYCSLISTGEKSGTLDKILNRFATYMEKSATLKSKIKKALVYPAAIIAISLIVSSILLIFVVPQFQTIYSSFGAELPYFTRMVVHVSEILRHYWWMVLLSVAAAIFGFRRALVKSEVFAEKIDSFKLKVPVFGELLKKGIIARFTRTLAISLDSGMPIVDAMRSMGDVMDNKMYRKAVIQICNEVVNGNQLSVAINNTKLFPNLAVQMIAIGEASGSLGEMLNKVADYYEEDVGHMVDNLSNLLEPLIMVVLGVIIGGFVIAMYLPIFKIGSIVK
ncbi:MAG: type II secretion system F family protein [Gammaproteobacteria bacterium]|nr:type II secretion system F family protein [Gammaproteobacteria bacterium]